jgi:hypothetical protein
MPATAALSNRLIAQLPAPERTDIISRSVLSELTFDATLLEAGRDIRHIYFPTAGFVSIIATTNGDSTLEVGLTGCEGMVGAPLAAIGGAFLWSLTSARGHWRREVLWRLAPDRAWSQERVETIAAMREQVGGFRLLAPEGWPGALTLQAGSWSVPPRGRKVLHEVTVVADQGDPLLDPAQHTPGWRPAQPRVEIHVSRYPQPFEEMALDRFLEHAFPPPSAPDLEGLEVDRQEAQRRMRAWQQEADEQREQREAELADRWRQGTVVVDGVAVPARLLTHDETDVGVATFDLDGDAVLVVAEEIGLDAIRLVGVADPEPLLDEFEVRQRRPLPGTTA